MTAIGIDEVVSADSVQLSTTVHEILDPSYEHQHHLKKQLREHISLSNRLPEDVKKSWVPYTEL